MKIEIEYEEVEHLRNQVIELSKQKKALEEKIKSLNEEELKSQAITLANTMFLGAMQCVFEKLGFEDTNMDYYHADFGQLQHWLGKFWYQSDRICVELGANITTMFRGAYLKIGIIAKKED